jgi:periplasmic copper chaperone A
LKHFAALTAAVLALFACAIAGAVSAPLSVQDAWVRTTPGSDVAAVYLTLHNGGGAAVVIVAVSSPWGGEAMIHETTLANGQYSMRAHPQLRIAPGETVQLAPGGLHIMLHGLGRPLLPGQDLPLLLRLEDGSTVSVTARVRALGAE